jgi:hypothetical protein
MSGKKKTWTGKYQPNAFQLFDCPVTGCDMKGRHGLPNPQAVGAHMRSAHKGIKVATAGASNGNHAEDPEEQDIPNAARRATPELAQAAIDRMAEGTGFAPPQLPKPTKAADAVTAVLKLPELRALDPDQVSTVFSLALAVIELDDGRLPGKLADIRAERASRAGAAPAAEVH